MKNNKKNKSNNKITILIISILLIYVIIHLVNSYKKLDSYNAEIFYYEEKIEALKQKQEELKEIQSNVNSAEYIEKMPRENLDMYYSNEKVYIDISK